MSASPTCRDCGRAFTPTRHKQRRCPLHEATGRASRSPSTQAQDAEYRHNRHLLLDVDDPRCAHCGAPATTADHVVPVSAGGSNRLENLQRACAPCNSARRDDPDWRPPPA